MAELVDIQRVEIGPDNLVATVRLDDDAPLMTSDDLKGTARVYQLLPHIVEHACIGDAGETFREAMGKTELAHLLEHVTVELLAQTDLAGDMPAGRTWIDEVDDRTYQIELACPDDVLVSAALSCGVWILDWAYRDGSNPAPDVPAIVQGLVNLVQSVEGQGEDLVVDYVPEFDDEPLEDEELFEDEERDDEGAESEAPAEAEPAPAPAATPAPLWTEAPEVPTRAARARETEQVEDRDSAMEAELDQIMATIEMPILEMPPTTEE